MYVVLLKYLPPSFIRDNAWGTDPCVLLRMNQFRVRFQFFYALKYFTSTSTWMSIRGVTLSVKITDYGVVL